MALAPTQLSQEDSSHATAVFTTGPQALSNTSGNRYLPGSVIGELAVSENSEACYFKRNRAEGSKTWLLHRAGMRV